MKKKTKPKTSRQHKQELWLNEYLVSSGNKSAACRETKIHYDTMRLWFREDEEFVSLVSQREEQMFDELAACVLERAKDKSDTLAIFLMKAHNRDKYDDNFAHKKMLREAVEEIRPELMRFVGEVMEQAVGVDPYEDLETTDKKTVQ